MKLHSNDTKHKTNMYSKKIVWNNNICLDVQTIVGQELSVSDNYQYLCDQN